MHRWGRVSPEAGRHQHATKDRDVAFANALGEVTPLRPTATDG